MGYFHIGAVSGAKTACHSMEDWQRLLAAMERNDHEAVIAITTTARPVMVPTASLKPVPRSTTKDAAAAFWTKKGKPPRARATDASGDPIVRVVRS